jgi:hypothetical protein
MTFSVYYSLTTEATDDFVLLKSWDEDDFNDGEPTILTLNLVGSEIARARHYRLKITVSSNDDVKLCGIERRYRIQGRSR